MRNKPILYSESDVLDKSTICTQCSQNAVLTERSVDRLPFLHRSMLSQGAISSLKSFAL